ncbi:arginine deiminase family protein [Ornithinimicrobium sp. INDO-MA30-4]|nr:arginine deiminase family protein [Ornithinimicrobium sp. INDO-MA30-4]UJH69743.1 arginine deiminase family protein [Ornithinimicrobium sp. INDO-MA30-4]
MIVHRPGLEMDRLTPSNKDQYLFDEILWLEQAQREHDGFVKVMEDRGVVVHHFDTLLRETIAIPEARQKVIELSLDSRMVGPLAADAMRAMVDAMSNEELTTYLIAGITKGEVLERIGNPHSMLIDGLADHESLMAPLPNHLFTRDTSAWVYGGVTVNSMHKRHVAARRCTTRRSTPTTRCLPTQVCRGGTTVLRLDPRRLRAATFWCPATAWC